MPTYWAPSNKEGIEWKKVIDDEELNLKSLYFKYTLPKESIVHTHNYSEYILVLKGNLTVTVKDKVYKLEEGKSITVPPNTPHYTLGESGTVVLVTWHPLKDSKIENI